MTSKLHDFDQPSNYENDLRAILSRETSNIVVDFNSKSVHAAVDLYQNDIKEILEAPVSNTLYRICIDLYDN